MKTMRSKMARILRKEFVNSTSKNMKDISVLPLRTLDAEKDAALRFYYRSSRMGYFLLTFLPITLCLSVGSIFLGFTEASILGLSIAALLALLRARKVHRRLAHARFVYEYGDQGELVFTNQSNNYSIKVNGMPQQIITVVFNGKSYDVKTFDQRRISVLTIPRQIAYAHPQYPDVIVPSGLFQLQRTKTAGAMGWLGFLLPFAFVFGLIYFIYSQMNGHSHTYAQPDALMYKRDGKWILATVINNFQAYEVSNKGIYGTDYYYAEGLDLQSGDRIWKVKLNNRGSGGGARLLGQSSRYLFFLHNGLVIVDKETGKVAGEDLASIKDKLPQDVIANYESDAGYTYDDSLQAVVVKGNDGLSYTIDGATLKTGTIDVPNPDDYFKNHFRFGNNYEDWITAVYDDGTNCMALIDTKDTVLLATQPYGIRERPAQESIRRTLYGCAVNTRDSHWTKLNPGVFLLGGFLVDPSKSLQVPMDSASQYASFQSLLERYNHSNPPMRTASGAFLLLHRASIEPDAPLLLTAVSPTGNTLWQVNMPYASIPLQYHDDAGDALYLFGNAKGSGSDDIDQATVIDLKTGGVKKYGIK